MNIKERILIALDTSDRVQALSWAKELRGQVGGFKIGLELVNAAGLDILSEVQQVGEANVFYDAKFHDIPNTVAKAVSAACKRDIWMLNVHASGGSAMMQAAVDAASEAAKKPLMIAVTVLTSISADMMNKELGIENSPEKQVLKLAQLAQASNMDGVVCSAREVLRLRQALGDQFVLVTPGIRMQGDAVGDQVRIATPGNAVRDGASYLVIGRSVTAAENPQEKLQLVIRDIQTAFHPD